MWGRRPFAWGARHRNWLRVQTGQPTPDPHCVSRCPTFRRFMGNLQKAFVLGDWSGLTSPALGGGRQVHGHSQHGGWNTCWTLDGQQVYDPCASLRTPACRELSPRIMDMYIHQTIHNFANTLLYSKYLGWLSAEASTRVGVGA